MLVKGDKIVLVKPMGVFDNIGEICDVVDVNESCISFSFGGGQHMGCMSLDEFYKYFEKYEKKNKYKVTARHIENILSTSEITVKKVFDKCTIVACKLPNGFVIVESSACVDPKNYNEKIGVESCMNRIKNKVWELEGYHLQYDYYCSSQNDCDNCNICNSCNDQDICFMKY